jgi:hypothetical protein
MPAGMVCQKVIGVTSMTQGLSVTYSLSFQRSAISGDLCYESTDLDRETYHPVAKTGLQ